MLVTIATVAGSRRKLPSLSSASTTIQSPWPEPGVGAIGVDDAAVDHGRVEPGGFEQGRDHRGRRGLAVRAGDRDRPLQPHQLGQHLGAAHHRQARAGRAATSGLSGLTAEEITTTSAPCRDSPRHGRSRPGCRARRSRSQLAPSARSLPCTRIAEIVQDLGDAAHADAADADEMDRADSSGSASSCGAASLAHAPATAIEPAARPRPAAPAHRAPARPSRASRSGARIRRCELAGQRARRVNAGCGMSQAAPARRARGHSRSGGRRPRAGRAPASPGGRRPPARPPSRRRSGRSPDAAAASRAGMSVKKLRELGVDAEPRVGGADPLEVLGPACWRPAARAQLGRQRARRRRHDIGEDPRALAAAQHQDPEPVRRRRSGGTASGARIAGRTGLPVCTLRSPGRAGTSAVACEAGGDGRARRGQQPVGAAEHGVLLVDRGRNAELVRRQHRRDRGIAAEADHRRRAEPAQQPSGLRPRPSASWRRPRARAASCRRRAAGRDHG